MRTIWEEMLEDEIARAKELGDPRPQQNCRGERSVSERAYAGFRCEKHPMLFGVRRKKDGRCYDCATEDRQKYRQRPEVKTKIAAKKKERRGAIERTMREAKLDAEAKALAYDEDPAAWVKYASPQVRSYFGAITIAPKHLQILARAPEGVVHSPDGTDDDSSSPTSGA